MLGQAQRAEATLTSGCSIRYEPEAQRAPLGTALGGLGKIVTFVTFVCFAVEKEAKFSFSSWQSVPEAADI
jgi:hypothetical protein